MRTTFLLLHPPDLVFCHGSPRRWMYSSSQHAIPWGPSVLRFWSFALNSAFCKGRKFEFQTRRRGFKSLSFPAAWSLATQLSTLCLSTRNTWCRKNSPQHACWERKVRWRKLWAQCLDSIKVSWKLTQYSKKKCVLKTAESTVWGTALNKNHWSQNIVTRKSSF